MGFERKSKRNPEKCPYYRLNPLIPCHPIKNLNCLLCACQNYDSENLGRGCNIHSRKGKYSYHKNLPMGRIWDCSNCPINHSEIEVEEYLKKNLGKLIDIYYSI